MSLKWSLCFFVSISCCTAMADTYDELRKTLEEARNAKPPSAKEIEELNYGKPPKNHEKLFKGVALESLKDPDSAKFRKIMKPKKMWGKSVGIVHFWIICGEVNAKNSYGGYEGYHPVAVRLKPTGETDLLPLNEDGSTMFTYASERRPCSR